VSGVQVRTRLTSLRTVEWARFEPNFFAIFQPAALRAAPKQFVLLAKVPGGGGAVADLQRRAVRRYPDVASLDLSLVEETVSKVLRKVAVAVRFMAIFSLAMGVPVLFSAVAATRRERVREAVLLKTLGATRAQIERILFAEYALLGALGSLTGVLLSVAAAWWLARHVFDVPFAPAAGSALLVAAGMTGLAVAIGVLSGRDVFRETPAAALRES
jgi:putative ABC transport system permease protein